MRFDFAVLALSLVTGAAATAIGDHDAVQYDALGATESHELYKRRGGGGGGGRGGGGGGGSRGGGSSSGGSRGGSGSSGSRGGSSGSSSPNTRPNSNTGGTSKGGSGPQPSFGGNRYYGGGATQPFRAGGSSRGPGVGTGLAAGALLGASAIALWPPHWHMYHGGVYPYHYRDEYEFYNQSAQPPRTERLPVVCGCAKGSECSCDDSGDKSNLKELIGDGDYAKLNKSVIDVAKDEKGRKTIYLDGTLPNGTTTSDAPSFGNSGVALGLWPAAAAAFAIVFTS